jgi:hypothetical protein
VQPVEFLHGFECQSWHVLYSTVVISYHRYKEWKKKYRRALSDTRRADSQLDGLPGQFTLELDHGLLRRRLGTRQLSLELFHRLGQLRRRLQQSVALGGDGLELRMRPVDLLRQVGLFTCPFLFICVEKDEAFGVLWGQYAFSMSH